MNLRRIGTWLLAGIGLSQSPLQAQPPLEFEVASLKPSGPQSVRNFEGGPGSKDPKLYRASVASLRDLIAEAWKVGYFQISSTAPLDRQNFDLVATVPEGATKEQFRLMLQRLLAERFALKTHIESREFSAYELVIAKNGSKLKEVEPGAQPLPATSNDNHWPELEVGRPGMISGHTVVNGFPLVRMRVQELPMAKFAGMLPTLNGTPVADKTALTGKYSFNLEYSEDSPGSPSDAVSTAPGLSTALQEQLGLQLVSKKRLFDVVVVESFNKLPAAN